MLTPQQEGRRSRKRRFRRRVTAVLVTLLLLTVASPVLIGWLISIELRSEISARLNARLETGLVLYFPPYTLHISHARLLTHAETGSMLSPFLEIAQLNVTLAKSPLSSGPLVIQQLEITKPILHLIQTPTGLTAAELVPSTQASGSEKISDLFQLRHVAVNDGRLEYENGTTPGTPVIWEHLSADLKTTATSPSNYHYEFVAQDAPLANITSAGQMDIDSLLLDVSSLKLDLQTSSTHPGEQLPSQVQEIFHRFAVAGHVTLEANAHIPLTDPSHAVFASQLRLAGGSAQIPGWNAPITPVEFSIDCYKAPQGQSTFPADVRFKLNQFVIQCEKQKIRLDTGNARFTTTDRTWAFDNITGLIDVGDGPGYASDYDILANLPINADGFGQFASTNPFTFHIYVNNGDLKVAPQKLPFQQINGLLTLTSRNVSTTGLTAVIYDGELSFAGMIDWSPGDGINYSGNGSLTNMTMKKFAANFTSNAADLAKVSGASDLRARFSGNTIAPSPAATLLARGDFDVRHGHFFLVPVLKNVLQKTKYADDATVGEVAAVFDISNRNINFGHVAAGSPRVRRRSGQRPNHFR